MINKDFFAALDELETERGIKKEVFIDALQNALAAAYRKQYVGKNGKVEVRLNPEKGTIRFFAQRTVVEEVQDKDSEISLEEARAVKPSAKVGDVLSEEFASKDFGRIAAQTAKQIIQQKLRETERNNTLTEFSDKENELLTGVVRKVELKNVYVEIGSGSIEGLLLPQDQVPASRDRGPRWRSCRKTPRSIPSAPASGTRVPASMPSWKNSAARRSTSSNGAKIRSNSSPRHWRPRPLLPFRATRATRRQWSSCRTINFPSPSAGTDRTPVSPPA